MLDRDKALSYYKSLIFNHYESGGTCEQRVLVLRARFDRILEELSDHNDNSQNFYVEKLQQIFKLNTSGFTQRIKDECHALRKYLNGVQHSTFEADEQQYILSLKRLCVIIHLTSHLEIPNSLTTIWEGDNNLYANKINSTFVEKNNRNRIYFPVALCIDTLKISKNVVKRHKLNDIILNFIKEISDNELPIQLRLYFIEQSKIKVIDPFENNVTLYALKPDFKNEINVLIDKIYNHLSQKNIRRNVTSNAVSPWFISLLDQNVLDSISSQNKFSKENGNHSITVVPIGLSSGMNLTNYKYLTEKREAMILQEGKENNFFTWLIDCFKIICKNKQDALCGNQ